MKGIVEVLVNTRPSQLDSVRDQRRDLTHAVSSRAVRDFRVTAIATVIRYFTNVALQGITPDRSEAFNAVNDSKL